MIIRRGKVGTVETSMHSTVAEDRGSSVMFYDGTKRGDTTSGERFTNATSSKKNASIRGFISSPLCGMLSTSSTYAMPSVIIAETGTNTVLNPPNLDVKDKRVYKSSRQSDPLSALVDKVACRNTDGIDDCSSPTMTSTSVQHRRSKHESTAVFWDVSRLEEKDRSLDKRRTTTNKRNSSSNNNVGSNNDEDDETPLLLEPPTHDHYEQDSREDDMTTFWFPSRQEMREHQQELEESPSEHVINPTHDYSSVYRFLECYQHHLQPKFPRDADCESCF